MLRQAHPRALLVFAVLLAPGCTELTRPPAHRAYAAPQPLSQGKPAVIAAEVDRPAPVVSPGPATDAAPPDQIGAAHILVAYQGATRAKPTVTRTKAEARELAARLATEARKPGTDFAKLAQTSSDGPSGIEGGALAKFGRQQMVKPFSDAAFALKPGEVSELVETNFGFHIIKRTE